MSTISTLNTSDSPAWTLITKFNDNFSALNTDKAEKSWGTFTGDISVPDEAYWVGWDGSTEVPTKNSIYDKIESLPVLSDGDKGDITVSGGIWTIDNNAVSNAKLDQVSTATFKGRTTAGTWNVEDLTATQATALLNEATTSLKGLMSSADKTKLDNAEIWTLLHSGTITSISTTPYDTWAFTAYDRLRVFIDITWSATSEPALQFNSYTWADYISTYFSNTTIATTGSITWVYMWQVGPTSWYRMSWEIDVIGKSWSIRQFTWKLSATGGFRMVDGYWNSSSDITSIQFFRWGWTGSFSWVIRVYWKNN